MKKQWLPLVIAAFLVLAPAAGADDGSVWGSLEELVDQIAAWFSDELGLEYPPGGAAEPVDELGLGYPPHGATQPGDQPELGLGYPPSG